MALVAGSCAADLGSPGNFTGSDYALALANAMGPAMIALAAAQLAASGFIVGVSLILTKAQKISIAQSVAASANGIATATVAYFHAHAEVPIAGLEVTVTTQQLGRVPNPATPGANIDAPSSPVTIPADLGIGGGSLTIL
jgi:hypothetical protein